jgi:hypothetical protein
MIIKALQNKSDVINNKTNVIEKALLALVLISYFRAFMDGNKKPLAISKTIILK